MFTPSILAVILSGPVPPAPQLTRLEVERGPDSVHVLAYDTDGIATGILAACKCLPEIVDEFEGMECF